MVSTSVPETRGESQNQSRRRSATEIERGNADVSDHEMSGIRVGVLALQGDFAAHALALEAAGVGEVVEVRRPRQLDGLAGLVMPGGDLDVWRPYSKRYDVQFAGRTGYARVALEAGVPVVPVANAGAHETFLVLTDGQKLASFLRLPDLVRAHIWPVHISLPWGLAVGPWPHLPVPTKLRYRFGPAIHPEQVGLAPGEEPTDAQVDAFDALVRAGVQAELDRLRDQR